MREFQAQILALCMTEVRRVHPLQAQLLEACRAEASRVWARRAAAESNALADELKILMSSPFPGRGELEETIDAVLAFSEKRLRKLEQAHVRSFKWWWSAWLDPKAADVAALEIAAFAEMMFHKWEKCE